MVSISTVQLIVIEDGDALGEEEEDDDQGEDGRRREGKRHSTTTLIAEDWLVEDTQTEREHTNVSLGKTRR